MKAFAIIFTHLVMMAVLVAAIWHWSHSGKLGVWPLAGFGGAYLLAFIRYGCLAH